MLSYEQIIESLNKQIDELKGENHRLSLQRDSTLDLTEKANLIKSIKHYSKINRSEDIILASLRCYLSFLKAKTLP